MPEAQNDEFNEVGAEDVISLMSQEIAKTTREKLVEQAKSIRLISIIEQSRAVIKDLDDEVKRLTELLNEPKGRKVPADRKPRGGANSAEVVAGEVIEDKPL